MKVIFILSSGHCGSTLLDLILDSHSEICGIGELENFSSTSICACGKTLKNCDFWLDIGRQANLNDLLVYRRKIAFLLGKEIFYIKKSKSNSWSCLRDYWEFIKRNEDIFNIIFKKSGAGVIVDSSKNPDRVELLCRSKKIEPVVIHLVRDGRAVSWSYLKKYHKFFPYVWKWFAANLKVEILKKRQHVKYIFLRYEDLANRPEEAIKKILMSVGLNYEETILRFRQGTHHQVGGNRMKLRQDEEIKEDMEWQTKMPLKYKILFNVFFGWLNYYYQKIK